MTTAERYKAVWNARTEDDKDDNPKQWETEEFKSEVADPTCCGGRVAVEFVDGSIYDDRSELTYTKMTWLDVLAEEAVKGLVRKKVSELVYADMILSVERMREHLRLLRSLNFTPEEQPLADIAILKCEEGIKGLSKAIIDHLDDPPTTKVSR